jgi:hypothetical protein
MKKVARTDRVDLIRDLNNNALLNTNNDALEAYKKKKRETQRILQLERDVADIKNMMSQLMEYVNGSRK